MQKTNSYIQLGVFIICLFLAAGTSFSQQLNSGYGGKKNVLYFTGSGGFRGISLMVGGLYNYVYYPQKDMLQRRPNLFRWDSSIHYTRILSRRIGLGVVLNYSQITPSTSRITLMNVRFTTSSNNYHSVFPNSSTPTFDALGARIALTFCSENSLLPIGFSHTLSLGPRLYILNTSYPAAYAMQFTYNNQNEIQSYSISQGTRVEQPTLISPPPSGFQSQMWGIDFCYSGRVSYPITKFFMIDFGYDFRIGGVFSNYRQQNKNKALYTDLENSFDQKVNHAYWNRDFFQALSAEALTNIFHVRLGFAFCF
jgi:hypothetical protein